MAATVLLYQDSVGNLLLHREGDTELWSVVNPPDAGFTEDALLLAAGQTTIWATQMRAYPLGAFDSKEKVLIWHGPTNWEFVVQPNKQALAYLGLADDYDAVRGRGRPSAYFDARQRLNIEVRRSLLAKLDNQARERGVSRTVYIDQLLSEGANRNAKE